MTFVISFDLFRLIHRAFFFFCHLIEPSFYSIYRDTPPISCNVVRSNSVQVVCPTCVGVCASGTLPAAELLLELLALVMYLYLDIAEKSSQS